MIVRPCLALAALLVVTPHAAVAQISDLNTGPGTVGERVARSSVKSESALQRAERDAAKARSVDEARYKRRDANMRRSLGSICRGC